ncbi:hypothetical protein BofuT4_P113560.1 [Botrytis cinerea T4]|uniref:Uncharacterized protein n=1 Tax=Botryotinia fuckeliana (strain T4) TaxID=999810 RepID=G2Y5B2_BOTF4|nr:hypothetical protein BofuT4_P113560.1 [Botrytis cinerea T4]
MASYLRQLLAIDFDALNLTMTYILQSFIIFNHLSTYVMMLTNLNPRLLNFKVHFLKSSGIEGFCCKSVPVCRGELNTLKKLCLGHELSNPVDYPNTSFHSLIFR